MTEKEWDTFFDLLVKVVNMDEATTWQGKKEVVESEAFARDVEMSLEEFIGWFD